MTSVTILGAGVMGASMCMPLADAGHRVNLVGTHLDDPIIAAIRGNGLHPKLNVTMPSAVEAFRHEDLGLALDDSTALILLGVSSAGVDWAIDHLGRVMKRAVPVLMVTKGMKPEANTMRAFPDVVAERLTERLGCTVPVAAIAGPCIAGELAARRQTGTVIVSRDIALAQELSAALAGSYYLPRPSNDMIGAETCAAFKNFFAIAVGWAHGQMDVLPETQNKARNNNAAAILFDQSVRELLVLTLALGGRPESVWGMPGVGDLYVTCQAGRNSRLGNALGRGLTFAQAKEGPLNGETVEGAELGLAVAHSIYGMINTGQLKSEDVPLTLALLSALRENSSFVPPWSQLHRST